MFFFLGGGKVSLVGVGGGDRVGDRYYTPLYQNGIKEVRIESMETTVQMNLDFGSMLFRSPP